MKLFFPLAFIVLANCAFAQVPQYFDNNPEWRQSSDCSTGLPCVARQDYVYSINGDSIIDGVTYKKLFKRGVQVNQWFDSPPVPSYCNTSWVFNDFHSLVRQEERKIYILQGNEAEALLYDFDLAVGDTLPITSNQWQENIIVTSIDSILVGDSYRKIFNLTEQSSPQLIEGIGHEMGFIEPFPPILECGYSLLCYALDDSTYYPNYNSPCDLTVTIKQELKANTLRYYPNPASNSVTIEFGNPEAIKEVFAINISGEIITLDFKQTSEKSILADLSILSKGLYMIHLIGELNERLKLKVLKH